MVLKLAPWSAAAVKIMPRIGPAHGAHSRPVATPSTAEDQSFPSALRAPASREPSATSGRVMRSERLREDQRDPEQREQDQRRPAAELVGANRPAAADRCKRRDNGEGRGHADEQRQGAADEAAVGAGEDERQHRQDARADNGQHAAQIGKKDDQHAESLAPWHRKTALVQHAVHRCRLGGYNRI